MHTNSHGRVTVWLALFIGGLSWGCGSSTEPCDNAPCDPVAACRASDCPPTPEPQSLGELGRFTSTTQAPEQTVIFATHDATHHQLVIGRRTREGLLSMRTLSDASLSAAKPSGLWAQVAHDQVETTHLAWHDEDDGSVHYGKIVGDVLTAEFMMETVDGLEGAIRGHHLSLALDEQGTPHLSYRDVTDKSLRYAYRDEQGWKTERVPPCRSEDDCPEVVNYGEFTSIVVIAKTPRIAFYDRTAGDLKLAQRGEDEAWSVTTLDGTDPETGVDTGDVGRFATMATDSKRRLGIAYFDASRGALRYLFASTTQATPVIVDEGRYGAADSGAERRHIVGQHVTLSFDAQDTAVMVYLDATQLALKASWVQGNQVNATRTLVSSAPGAWFDLLPQGDEGFIGAYGAWSLGEAPERSLGWFELPKEAP